MDTCVTFAYSATFAIIRGSGGERERVKGVGSTRTNTNYHLLEVLVFFRGVSPN
jgi:hypothetical protein